VTHRVSVAYEGVAAAWAAGPSRVYDMLADAIVAAYPDPLTGLRVVDLGAGTGAVSRSLMTRNALPVAVDLAADMVEHMRAQGIEALAGDICALPFPDAAFDGAVAAFSVSHVSDPVAAIAEARRVVRRGGVVLVGVFAAEPVANAAKGIVDGIAGRFGFVHPSWYTRFKNELEPATSTPEKLRRCAERACLVELTVVERVVDTGVNTPADIVAARLGMAHLASFVQALSPQRRDQLFAAAVDAVAHDPQPIAPAILILSGRVPAPP
jgi:SAM-dependent methyltransferase